MTDQEILDWLKKLNKRTKVVVTEKKLASLDSWVVYDTFGNISHETGKFFTIKGMDVVNGQFFWEQPIISQPEIGILGLIVAFSGEDLYALVQAKIEPGNINGAQLSPTVQATKSNYFGIHKGKAVNYIDFFLDPKKKVVSDSFQSEQGSRFFKKINRNIVIVVPEMFHLPKEGNFCWVKLKELSKLHDKDNIVNMDLRTVLGSTNFARIMSANSVTTDIEYNTEQFLSALRNKISNSKMRSDLRQLQTIRGWNVGGNAINHIDERFFSVIGAHINVEGREVQSWQQPLIKPSSQGIIMTPVCWRSGELLIAHRFIEEPGLIYGVEAGPLYQSSDGALHKLPPNIRDLIDGENNKLVDVLLSEEGGRFYHEVNRNIVIQLPYIIDLGPDVVWTPLQVIKNAVSSTQCVNMCLRSLIYLIDSHLMLEQRHA